MAIAQAENVLTQQSPPNFAAQAAEARPTAAASPSWRISPALRQQILDALHEKPQLPKMTYEEFYRLSAERYRLAFEGREGEYHAAAVPGFWLRVEWLWQEPLPASDEVLLTIGGIEYARRQIRLIRERGLWPADAGE